MRSRLPIVPATLPAAFLLLGQVAGAATLDVPVDHLTREKGLPFESVQSVVQDHRGFIWMAASRALLRFDGRDFVAYRHDPEDPGSLGPGPVEDVIEDSRKTIWVATGNGGLSRLDPGAKEFRHYRHRPGEPDSLGSNNVWRVMESSDGSIWAGTFGGGLNRLDPETGEVTVYRHHPDDPGSLPGDVVSDVVEGPDGDLYLAVLNEGVSRLDPATGRFTNFGPADGLCGAGVWTLTFDDRGGLWVRTGSGVARRRAGDDAFECLKEGSSGELPFHGEAVQAIHIDQDGRLWVVWARKHIGIYDPEDRSFSRLRLFDGSEPVGHLGIVTGFFRDSGGVLWFGSDRGVYRLTPTWRNFDLWLVSDGAEDRAAMEPRSLYEDADGSIWLGTVNDALQRLDPVTGRMTGFPPSGEAYHSRTARVLDILPAGDDRFWMASFYGIVLFDRADGTWKLSSHREAPGMAGEGYATSLLPASDGAVWMGTAGGGLKRFDPESGEFSHYLFEIDGEPDAGHNTINGLVRGPDGRILTLNHAGVDRFDPDTGRFQPLMDGLDAGVLDMARHPDGTYWLATNLGLVQARLEPSRLRVMRHLTTGDGLPENELLSLQPDDSGRLWITTPRELVRFDPGTGEMRVLDAANGLPNVAFTKLLHQGESGQLHVGLMNGLARFHPERLEFPSYRPPVVLTDLRIMNRSVMQDERTESSGNLALDHEDRMVTFQFAALDYAAPGDIAYQYRLDGFDESWIRAGNRREATYTNLPPGSFTFRVRSTNSYGEWQPAGLAVALEIAPPPWRTWWAYSLYALAAFLILAGAFLVYRRKVARDHQLARERDQRQWAEDLHDLTRSLAASLKSEEILSRYLDGLANAVRYEAGMVYLAPGDDEPMAVGRGYTNHHRPPHTRQLRRALTTVRASHQPVDMTLENGTTRQTLALPLLWRSEVLGVVLLERARPFTPRERATALALGEQAGTALENARLFGEVEHLAHDAQAASRAKSDFLARMSHEIRTPMNGVLGMAELLMESRLTPEQYTYARAVKDSGDLLLALINDILDFSRIEAGKLDLADESFDLGRLLAEVVTLFGGRAVDKGLALTYEIDPEVPRDLRGDPQRLHQVLMNLAGNAFKFTEHGRVSIRVRCESADSRRVTLACEVDDTGIGIPRDAQMELFQAFSQVESATGRRYGGTGLGLAICRELVEKMGGEIGVDSEPGNGSRFYFTVQLETSEANDTVGQAARRIKGRRVLVACRDEVTGRGLMAMLGNLGVRTGELTEETSVDAGDWDAVLADWDGPVFRRAPDYRAGVPLVALVPFGGEPDEEEWRRQGASGMVRVPVREPELVGRLLAVMEGDMAGSSPDARHEQADHRSMNILVVEDNPIGQEVLQDLLENWGHRVDVVDSGREALYGLQQRLYDLVFLDCELPGMDGLEVATAIRAFEKEGRLDGHVPVVALTGRARPEHRAQCMEAGMDDYLSKPVNGETLRAVVRRWAEVPATASPDGD